MILSVAVATVLLGTSGQESVRWERHWTVAVRKARAAQKPLMVDFWADWCGWCHKLDETTYADPHVIDLSRGFIPVKVDTEGGARQSALAQKYHVTNLPTIMFLSPLGNPVLRLTTYQGPGQFPRTMAAAREAAARVMAWEEKLRHNPSDADALADFGVHLFEQEFYADAKELLARARKLDKREPLADRKSTRMLLAGLERNDGRYAEAEGILKEALDLPPLPEYDAKLLYVMGKTYAAWGKPAEARAAFKVCLKEYPHHSISSKVRQSLDGLDQKK